MLVSNSSVNRVQDRHIFRLLRNIKCTLSDNRLGHRVQVTPFIDLHVNYLYLLLETGKLLI